MSRIYQDASQALRVGNPRPARIDVSKLGFLARRDLPPVVLPTQQNPPQFAIPLQQVLFVTVAVVEGIASSSHLSLEEEIDRFHFAEEERTPERPVELLDSETKSDRLSASHQPGQTIALVKTSSEEAEIMDLKKRPGLRGLIANRSKGATPPEAFKTQASANLPLPPSPLPIDLGLRTNPNPKRKRPPQELEDGEMLLQRGTKKQKTKDPQDNRSKSMDSRDDAEVRRQQRTWAPIIEMDGAPIPYDSTIRKSSRGHSMYLAQALEWPLLLPKDMESLRQMRQPDLFMSLKRNLAMVSIASLVF